MTKTLEETLAALPAHIRAGRPSAQEIKDRHAKQYAEQVERAKTCDRVAIGYDFERSDKGTVKATQPPLCDGMCNPNPHIEAFAKLPRCPGSKTGMRAIARRVNVASVPWRFVGAWNPDWRDSQRAAIESVMTWVNDDSIIAGNCFVSGPVGSGKSFIAAWAAFELCRRKVPVRFIRMSAMLDDLRSGFDGGGTGVFDAAMSADVLILDDIGAERDTEWALDRVGALVSSRYDAGRQTLYTSNLSPAPMGNGGLNCATPDQHGNKTIGQALGERIASRIQGGATLIRVRGKDWRQA